jgi:hypothetical protein
MPITPGIIDYGPTNTINGYNAPAHAEPLVKFLGQYLEPWSSVENFSRKPTSYSVHALPPAR